ncbi:MAG: Nif11-like leader peptide family natural product precursor [Eggerthellaceae bacterium]|nr:Nif11-like leader peptide family natural product precursor [Eggerthellaceae bacterium]
MEFDEMSQELKDKARACKTPEEVLALAGDEGYELSDAELEQIAGGKGKWAHEKCDDFIRQGKPRKK